MISVRNESDTDRCDESGQKKRLQNGGESILCPALTSIKGSAKWRGAKTAEKREV
jgi:hypothetical protein